MREIEIVPNPAFSISLDEGGIKENMEKKKEKGKICRPAFLPPPPCVKPFQQTARTHT